MDDRFLRFRDLKQRGIPWCRMHLDRLEKAGQFPKRVQLSEGTVRWLESEVDAFVADKVANRGKAAA